MSTTQPIRNRTELKRFTEYYKKNDPNLRNNALICVGLNSALRISDELSLKWKDIYNFNTHELKEHLTIIETKTGKERSIYINYAMRRALLILFNKTKPSADEYVFSSAKNPEVPLSRVHAYRIIKKAAEATLTDPSHISCHSLRKTFGYHAYKQGVNLALITEIFNHSSYVITKHYIGIDQDELDMVYSNFKY